MTPRNLCVAAVLLAVACESPQGPEEAAFVQSGALASGHASTGGGEYLLAGAFPMHFSLSAVALPGGGAAGRFHQRGDVGGIWVDVHGRVTCVAVDPVNHRAWIGGVVTHNRSDADLQEAINQPGQDVWFRVVDYGEGTAAQADRMTFLGFTGSAGIITSQEYCDTQPWPDDDARTHPVTSGNIQVR